MSSTLMSCVREHSPPLDVPDVEHGAAANVTGAQSLPAVQRTVAPTTPASLTPTPALVDSSSSSTIMINMSGGSAPSTEQKRRRFHPLRNLRRIFRRRTITSVADTPTSSILPPTNSTSEKNLRSATLSSISSSVSASSPSSPLSHPQLQDAFSSQSLPKSKSYTACNSSGSNSSNVAPASKKSHRDVLLTVGGKHRQQKLQQLQQEEQQQQQTQPEQSAENDMSTTTTSLFHHHSHHRETGGGVNGTGSALFQPTPAMRQSLGVAVLPSAVNRSFYAERQKLRSVGGDSSQELDSSGNDSGSATGGNTQANSGSGGASGTRTNGSASGGEMSDSQRSLSEGRLVDSDFCPDALSQSHDSVFSESASTSIFSNREYQAELSDVLRKRNRNRQDASEEDLGLPRSPSSPQRRDDSQQRNQVTIGSNSAATPTTTAGNQSEVSSLSLFSMNSDADEFLASSTANNSLISTETVQERSSSTSNRFTRSQTFSSSTMSMEMYRHSTSGSLGSEPRDDVDLFSADLPRLSHSAARHKMAVRPAKKKGPSRQHRRTLENSIPEANEDNLKSTGMHLLDTTDNKAKTRSLPPGVNAKTLEQHANEPPKHTAAPAIPSKTAISAAAGDSTLNIKRTKLEQADSITKITSHSSTTMFSTSSSSTSGSSSFGLRSLSSNTSSVFDSPKQSSSAPSFGSETESKRNETTQTANTSNASTNTTNSTTLMETSESGFLRRLMQRNSKRSISRTTAGSSDEPELSQSEPKKIQISTSCYDVKQTPSIVHSAGTLEKSKSAMSYEQNVEETRKEIKREIMSVGSTGLNAMFMITTPSSISCEKPTVSLKDPPALKPKSGAAARQRYLPQDIHSLERKSSSSTNTSSTSTSINNNNSNASMSPKKDTSCNSDSNASMSLKKEASYSSNSNASMSSKKEASYFDSSSTSHSSILSKQSEEVFQSTSIIREITASQACSTGSLVTAKSEHHFEKKPKIVGLSAFQQKISRSNESFGRTSTSTSTNSLETAGDTPFMNYEQSQRKAVEKSRSFRTYQEDKPATTVHNNMPSLPDLSLNLRVPCYTEFILHEKEYSSPSPPDPAHDKSNSLGFEINDNNLVKPTSRAVSASQLHTQQQSNSYTNNVIVNTATCNKIAPSKLLTPSVMPALSPSKSCSNNLSEIEQNIDLLVKSPFISVLRKSTGTNTQPSPPGSSSGGDEKTITTIALSGPKKPEEKSTITKQPVSLISVVPVPAAVESERPRPKVLHFKEPINSAPISPAHCDEKVTPTTATVPLRDKSKLSSPANGRISMHVPAAKEPEHKTTPTSSSNKSNSFKSRRSSSILDSGSADETSGTSPSDDVPEFMKIQLNRVDPARIAKSSNVVLAKNVKEPALSKESSTRSSSIDDLCLRRLSNESVDITEKDTPETEKRISGVFEAINKQAKSVSSSSIRQYPELPPKSPVKKSPTVATPTDVEEAVILRVKPNDAPTAETLANNKLSLLERKRIFMHEEKLKADKKFEERKKTITDEVYRRSFTKSEERLETAESTQPPESVVVLRKKSFNTSMQHSNSAATNASSSNNNKDDSTPELMKVFARRSLKIKDEDLSTLNDKIALQNCGHSNGGNSSNNSTSAKRFVPTQQNMDSDKENQSASDEKLDKLPKIEAPLEGTYTISKVTTSATSLNGTSVSSNRNSVADFRNSALKNGGALSNGLSLSNNQNNNNSSATTPTTPSSNGASKSFLPPIKVGAFRTMPIERNGSAGKLYATHGSSSAGAVAEPLNNNNHTLNNHNNNNNGHNIHSSKSTLERQSCHMKKFENMGGMDAKSAGSKTIERSATVGEFKGIHQRRAEWEQRAKEALK